MHAIWHSPVAFGVHLNGCYRSLHCDACFSFLAFTCSQAQLALSLLLCISVFVLCLCQNGMNFIILKAMTSKHAHMTHGFSTVSTAVWAAFFSLNRVFALRDRFKIQMITPARTRARLSWVCAHKLLTVCALGRELSAVTWSRLEPLTLTPHQANIQAHDQPHPHVLLKHFWAMPNLLSCWDLAEENTEIEIFSQVSVRSEPLFF